KGGKDSAFKFFKKIKVIKSTPSLGGVETLATYPILSASKSMPQSLKEELGITENLIRLSVGLEDIEDLKEDIEQALKD
ncbi:MAG: PLP-dependent transferase, partial [Nitrososphaeria archaeon]